MFGSQHVCSSDMQSLVVAIACTVNGASEIPLGNNSAGYQITGTKVLPNNPEVHFIIHVRCFYANSLIAVLLLPFYYFPIFFHTVLDFAFK